MDETCTKHHDQPSGKRQPEESEVIEKAGDLCASDDGTGVNFKKRIGLNERSERQ